MYSALLHTHSGLRWILLATLVYSVVIALVKWRSAGGFSKTNSLIASVTVWTAHLQLLIGLVLYFISPKVMFSKEAMSSSLLRFFTAEHILLMLLAIACLTIGNAAAKRTVDGNVKAKKIFVWFAIGFVLIIAGIPWPFRGLGSGWF